MLPATGSSRQQRCGSLRHCSEQHCGPLRHCSEQRCGPLRHCSEQGCGPLRHCSEQCCGSLRHSSSVHFTHTLQTERELQQAVLLARLHLPAHRKSHCKCSICTPPPFKETEYKDCLQSLPRPVRLAKDRPGLWSTAISGFPLPLPQNSLLCDRPIDVHVDIHTVLSSHFIICHFPTL